MKTLKIPEELHEKLVKTQALIYTKTGIKMPFYEIIANGNEVLTEKIKNDKSKK